MRPVRRRRRAERDPSGSRDATSSLVVAVAMRRPRTLAIRFAVDRLADREQGYGDAREEVAGALDGNALDGGQVPDHRPGNTRGASGARERMVGFRGEIEDLDGAFAMQRGRIDLDRRDALGYRCAAGELGEHAVFIAHHLGM